MNEIKFDKRNYRKHDKKNKSLIKKSLEKFGAGRSIVVDAEGEIIGGNGVYEQAQKLGLKTKIVETDGSELVVVKRTDLKTDDEKRKALAVMDNSTSDTSEFDLELLTADFSVDELEDFGIELPEDEEAEAEAEEAEAEEAEEEKEENEEEEAEESNIKEKNNSIAYKSPLPFQGQKRFFIKEFRNVLEKTQGVKIVVDLFGGSGLLSRIAKDILTGAKVIYNDFDNYKQRLENIKTTNKILKDIGLILKDYKKNQRVSSEDKNKILDVFKKYEENKSFVDYITLSSSVLFSSNYANSFEEMEKQTMWNRLVFQYQEANEYLNGLEVVSYDYRDLFEKYKDEDGVLFIFDPPYLTTDIKSYKNVNYWTLVDYLNILLLTKFNNFIYFTSNKGSLIDLIKWINNNFNAKILEGKIVERKNAPSGNVFYTDYMIYNINAD